MDGSGIVVSYFFASPTDTVTITVGPSTNFPNLDNNAIISAVILGGIGAESNAYYGVEDVDFTGNFLYCIGTHTSVNPGQIGDANCVSVNQQSDVVVSHQYQIDYWLAPYASNLNGWVSGTTYSTTEQQRFYNLVSSIKWTRKPGNTIMTMPVTAGQMYKLQVLLWESCCTRRQNMYVDEVLVAEDVLTRRDGMGVGQLFVVYVVPQTNTLTIRMGHSTNYYDIDNNPIFNAFTLEII
jgi:hypothetical protein